MTASFNDSLAITAALTIKGTKHDLPGGSVTALDLELGLHGFQGTIEFVVVDDKDHGGGFEDKLVEDFLLQDLGEISLSISVVSKAPEAKAKPDPINVAGLVIDRGLEEVQMEQHADRPILGRRYWIRFADPARVLWTQHHPCRLYTQSTLKDVIDGQTGDKITIKYDWAEVTTAQPMWFLHLPVEHGASFYDFVLWYADRRGGYFAYDYAAAGYTLKGTRDTSATAQGMFGDDLARVDVVVPETPRHVVDVCNSYVDNATTKAGTQAQSAKGIRHDYLMRSAISKDVDDRAKLENTRLVLPKYEVRLEMARLPVIQFLPGKLVEMLAANRWSKKSALLNKKWLVQAVSIRAIAPSGPLDAGQQIEASSYEIAYEVRLQQSDDTRAMHPPFEVPYYPGHVEGKVVSEKGEDGDKTYESKRNETTSLDEYTVKIPLWSNKTVTTPFAPVMGSGNVFLPCYRDERVLLGLSIDRAWIAELLAWREGASLSADVQGEQILFGKSSTSSAAIKHTYSDSKPVLDVVRVNESDIASISFKEGTLVLHVEEKQE